MHKSKSTYRLLIIFFCGSINLNCTSQVTSVNPEKEKITLISKITLPDVKGRIDHITFDPVNHLAFVAALSNNTVEVVNIETKQVIHTIAGLHEPQGVLYTSSFKRLVVANGDNGNCVFFDAGTYKESGFVKLKNDADNMRYDTASHFLYIGYGDGGIAVIDAKLMQQTTNIPLDGHPESFQISKKQNRIYINVPGADEIEVADLSTTKIISKWKNSNASSNFPMALDEDNKRLFIACRRPATLKMINTETGKDIYSVSCAGDADDVFYSDSLVFVSAGKGFIDVFRINQSGLSKINHIETSNGARTSFLLALERKFLLAVPAHNGKPAALWVYRIN